MPMNDNIFPVISQPGIQRDGTTFDSDCYIDGQWCRFYRGKPQKIGGYEKIYGWPTNVPRGIFIVPKAPNSNIYIGGLGHIKYLTVNNVTGIQTGLVIDRTPLLFNASQYNQWIFDIMYDTTSSSSNIIVMATQNLLSIDQTIESPIYYGPSDSTEVLVETGFRTSGGFVVLHPFLFIFGNDGYVHWTVANNPTIELGNARPTGTKIIAGLPARGGSNSPAGLLWSLDSLIRVTSVGTTDIDFSFDTVSSEISILSSHSVIEYNGNFYWVGVDTFYFYNGVVQEWPNSMSLEFFFNNLNFSQRQKVWVSKVTRYGEIWIFYPDGNNQECNRALIYCVREKSWTDTDIARGCGDHNPIFSNPVWCENVIDVNNEYKIWRHEVGVDKVIDEVHTAIESNFETSVISWVASGPGGQNLATDKTLMAYSFEPDFSRLGELTGDMTLTIKGRQYPNSAIVSSDEYIFNDNPVDVNFEEKIDLREKRRLMTLKISSNVIGGDYRMGKCLLVPKMGDTRP